MISDSCVSVENKKQGGGKKGMQTGCLLLCCLGIRNVFGSWELLSFAQSHALRIHRYQGSMVTASCSHCYVVKHISKERKQGAVGAPPSSTLCGSSSVCCCRIVQLCNFHIWVQVCGVTYFVGTHKVFEITIPCYWFKSSIDFFKVYLDTHLDFGAEERYWIFWIIETGV